MAPRVFITIFTNILPSLSPFFRTGTIPSMILSSDQGWSSAPKILNKPNPRRPFKLTPKWGLFSFSEKCWSYTWSFADWYFFPTPSPVPLSWDSALFPMTSQETSLGFWAFGSPFLISLQHVGFHLFPLFKEMQSSCMLVSIFGRGFAMVSAERTSEHVFLYFSVSCQLIHLLCNWAFQCFPC